MKNKGLSPQQVHRIKEDFQRANMVLIMLDKKAKQHKDEVLHDMITLAKEEYDAIFNDIEGMLNGNNRKGGEK